jgi:chromosome segregation ATPase
LNSLHQPSDQPELGQQLKDAKQTIRKLKDNLNAKENEIQSLQNKLNSTQDELISTRDELEYHYQKSQSKGLLIDSYQHQQRRAKALIASLLQQLNPLSRTQNLEPPQDCQTSP